MNKRISTRVAAALVFVLGFEAVRAGDVPAPEAFVPVREFLVKAVAEGRAPSIAVAVVKDGQLVWAEGFGYADLEEKRPATADSIYLLASVSKPITATGLMVLADRGQIDLDQPANDYLPGAKLRAYEGSPNEITLRRLANHTAGLPIHYNFYYDGVTPLSRDETIRQYGFAYVSPGKRVEYSNLAFGVLDYIVATVSRQPWGEFMEKNVFDPLGMTHTSDRVRPGLSAHATRQYHLDMAGRFVPVAPYRFDHDGASAIWSSAADLSRFLRMHLNSGIVDDVRLLRESTARSMLEVTGVRSADRPEDGFGVAWSVGSYQGHRCFEHSGGMPGVSTWIRGFPEHRAGFVVLVNASGSSVAGEVSERIARVLLPEAKDQPARSPRVTTVRADRKDFAGLWKGRLAHPDGDIPVSLEISDDSARAVLGSGRGSALNEVRVADGQLRGSIRGFLRTQPGYHGPVTLEFQLFAHSNRLTGVAVAKAEGYFALSHYMELNRETGSAFPQKIPTAR